MGGKQNIKDKARKVDEMMSYYFASTQKGKTFNIPLGMTFMEGFLRSVRDLCDEIKQSPDEVNQK